MVRRLFEFFHKEISGLHEAAYLLAFFTLLSQILALVRDRLFAHTFGAGPTLDIYYAAFRIPDLIFASVASIVSVSVLVPFLIERLDKDKEAGKRFIDTVFSFFFFLILAVAAVVFILMPILAPLFFPGFPRTDYPNLVLLARIMLLSPIFLGFSNFLASITQVYRRFFIYAISPILYNLGIIGGVMFLYKPFGIAGLALGVAIGAIFHCAVQVPFVAKHGLFPRLHLRFDMGSIRQVMLLSITRTLALSASQIAGIFLVGFASFMTAGSIAIYNFAFDLQSVPLSIIGVSYSVALFPTISRLFTSGETKRFVDEMVAATSHIIFWSLPVTVLFVVLRAQIVRVILGSGEFSWSNTRLTAAALALFSISVVAQSLSLLFIRAYYAAASTKRPLVIDFTAAGIVVATGFIFWQMFLRIDLFRYFLEALFRVSGIPGTEVLALPLGYTVGMIFNAVAFWIVFHKNHPGFSKPVLKTTFQSFSAAVIMGLVAYLGLNAFSHVFSNNTVFGVFMQGFLSGILGIAAGIAILGALGSRELVEVWHTLHRKIWKAKVLVPEQETML